MPYARVSLFRRRTSNCLDQPGNGQMVSAAGSNVHTSSLSESLWSAHFAGYGDMSGGSTTQGFVIQQGKP